MSSHFEINYDPLANPTEVAPMVAPWQFAALIRASAEIHSQAEGELLPLVSGEPLSERLRRNRVTADG
jgi:hypothetical protein